MVVKPWWWSWLVDGAQIVSAFAVTASVIVALYFARRSERQRLAFAVTYEQELMDFTRAFVVLTIVNSGLLPVEVGKVRIRFPKVKRRRGEGWLVGKRECPIWFGDDLPRRLEHGQSVSVQDHIHGYPWAGVCRFWWKWNRPYFKVLTSLGKVYRVRVSLAILRRIQREIGLLKMLKGHGLFTDT
jgi:hypothetical protein